MNPIPIHRSNWRLTCANSLLLGFVAHAAVLIAGGELASAELP